MLTYYQLPTRESYSGSFICSFTTTKGQYLENKMMNEKKPIRQSENNETNFQLE